MDISESSCQASLFATTAYVDLEDIRRGRAEYGDMAAMVRKLHQVFEVPHSCGTESRWLPGDTRLLHEDLLTMGTEHAVRLWLDGFAAVLGFPKSQRDSLGRWVPVQSDDYLHTAREEVYEVQTTVRLPLIEMTCASLKKSWCRRHGDI